MRAAGAAAAALLVVAAAAPARAQGTPPGVERAPFAAGVRTSQDGGFLIVDSTGIPSHATGTFPAPRNPNRIQPQTYRFYIPLRPQEATQPTALPRGGPIAIALSGIPFYNPNNAEDRNAVEGPYREEFDQCNGHPDPPGRYHYHQYSPCIASDRPGQHSLVIGYAFDVMRSTGSTAPTAARQATSIRATAIAIPCAAITTTRPRASLTCSAATTARRTGAISIVRVPAPAARAEERREAGARRHRRADATRARRGLLPPILRHAPHSRGYSG